MDNAYVPFKEANAFYGNLYQFLADLTIFGAVSYTHLTLPTTPDV